MGGHGKLAVGVDEGLGQGRFEVAQHVGDFKKRVLGRGGEADVVGVTAGGLAIWNLAGAVGDLVSDVEGFLAGKLLPEVSEKADKVIAPVGGRGGAPCVDRAADYDQAAFDVLCVLSSSE